MKRFGLLALGLLLAFFTVSGCGSEAPKDSAAENKAETPKSEAAADKGATQEQFITIGTGGITGVYYPVGGAICRLLNQDRQVHGLRCTVESTEASVFNVNALRAGDITLGVVQSDTQYQAINGLEKFQDAGKDEKLRALFSLYTEPFTAVARDDSGIKTFADFAGKRVNIGAPGSGSRVMMEILMKAYGWTNQSFALAADLKPAEMAGALCDSKIEAFVYTVGHPNASITEATTTCKSHLVPVEGPEVDGVLKDHPYYVKAAIAKDLYGNPEAVPSFGPTATLVTTTALSDEAAYTITKTVFENLDKFKALHPALANITAADMVKGNSAPFHPGAEKYFKEKGLL